MSKFRLEWMEEKRISSAESGTTILQARIDAGLSADAPCGGKGSCGKCMVEIREDENKSWRWVKACQYVIESDLQIRAPAEKELNVLVSGESAALSSKTAAVSGSYAVAFDIGTTSIVAYLLSMPSGRQIAALGMLNPQVKFGADVISRVAYAMENGVRPLTDCVRKALNDLIDRLCAKTGISRQNICRISIVGNTCMHHLFLGVSPESLGKAPYMPAVREAKILSAKDCGLEIHPDVKVCLPPVIAGFVGSDTVACMLAESWQRREKLSLMIDIGTNGELVMGNAEDMLACSTAAGPALEGAKISCGMRGAEGAVDRVWIENNAVRFHVIGDAEAKGICGSGIVDLVAVLLETGIIDETGRMEGGEYRLSEKVSFTQKDVREVQLAKAAIRAGIELMARHLGVETGEIEEVSIAGAFGNYMNAENACKIGMIPMELLPKIRGIGNAAGEGAKRILQDADAWHEACALARKTEFLELASVAEFQDEFVDALEFQEVEVC